MLLTFIATCSKSGICKKKKWIFVHKVLLIYSFDSTMINGISSSSSNFFHFVVVQYYFSRHYPNKPIITFLAISCNLLHCFPYRSNAIANTVTTPASSIIFLQ